MQAQLESIKPSVRNQSRVGGFHVSKSKNKGINLQDNRSKGVLQRKSPHFLKAGYLQDNRPKTVFQLKAGQGIEDTSTSETKSSSKSNLPQQLKAGIESLSSYSMDDVKVHYNSSKPAQLQAHAFAQGTDIHLSPGQEKHLPHEAWHVVQQKQGRVKPTLQLKSKVNVNDDPTLEREADLMGEKANKVDQIIQTKQMSALNSSFSTTPTIQRQIQLTDVDDGLYEETEAEKTMPVDTGFYYCGTNTTVGDKPIYVLKTVVDALEAEIEAIQDNEDFGQRERAQAIQFAVLGAAHNAVFYTDDGVFAMSDSVKDFRLKQALNHPLFKNPDRARGLEHRFADGDGVLFSKLTKEEVEEQLGNLPPTVTFYRIPADEWVAELNKFNGFWTEKTANYAYGRHMDKRGLMARAARSKFRQGTDSTQNHQDFQGDEKKAALPPVGPARQETEWKDYKGYANPKSREGGQYKAMGKWNALAYAAYMFHHGHPGLQLDQDWEWLHIQGAQNGGATNLANLVAGTSTTNSRMIPWEDNINAWTRFANRDHPLSVKFIGYRVAGTDLGKSIIIQVAAEKGIPGKFHPVPKNLPMTISFDPLNGTVYDKISNKITTKTLAKEAFHDSSKMQKEALVRDYVKSNKGKVNMFTVIGKSPYKGLNAEFRGYYRESEALVIVTGVQREVVIPLHQLKPRN